MLDQEKQSQDEQEPIGQMKCRVCGNAIDKDTVKCPICKCSVLQEVPKSEDNNDVGFAKKTFYGLIISVVVFVIGLILVFADEGKVTGVNVGTCLKCWGKGVVENAYGIMVKCNNCVDGQLAYQNSSFNGIGIFGTFLLLASGISTWFHWQLLKK